MNQEDKIYNLLALLEFYGVLKLFGKKYITPNRVKTRFGVISYSLSVNSFERSAMRELI